MCKVALADESNFFDRRGDLHCTLPDCVLRESPAQQLGNTYQNPGKHAAHYPPASVGPRANVGCSRLNEIRATAPKAHALNTSQDALLLRVAINAQQTSASCVKAAKGRLRKRDRESTRNLSRRTVPQTVCGTVRVCKLWCL